MHARDTHEKHIGGVGDGHDILGRHPALLLRTADRVGVIGAETQAVTRIGGEGGGEEGVEVGDGRREGVEVQVCQRVGDVFFVEGEEVGGADGDDALVILSIIVVVRCGHILVQSR